MGAWQQIIIFVALTLIISVLRNKLVFEIVGSSLLIFGTKKVGLWFYSLIFLPGTILHELSHWIVAELLGVRTGEITILPTFDDATSGSRERLGSVQTASTGPLRSFIIGAAPFFTGLTTLYLLGYFLMQGTAYPWQSFLLIYGIIVTGSSMLLSKEDRRTWLPITILFSALLILLYKLDYLDYILNLISNPLEQINLVLSITAVAIIAVIGISYSFRRIIELITKKKIVRS